MNVVLYEKRGGYWAMTERKQHRLFRSTTELHIGPSRLVWNAGVLTAEINEITVPIPQRLRGRIKLTPARVHSRQFALDAAGRHRWQPLAPVGRIEVAFDKPGISWSGRAYFDSNDGDEPLAKAFATWNWSRSDHAETSRIFYDVERRDGTALNLALQVDGTGIQNFSAPPTQTLPKTMWRVTRKIQVDTASKPIILKTLEDAPFYARSMVRTQILGQPITMIHESLDLNRFASPWVKYLLPFRMPRL